MRNTRTKDEVEEYRKAHYSGKELILSKKYATQKQLDTVDKSVKERVAECEQFAETSPYPDLNDVLCGLRTRRLPFIKHKL